MHLLRFSVVGFLLLCCALPSSAQFDLMDGYIIKNTRDTVFGGIRYTTPAARTVRITFVNERGEKMEYEPFQIKGFYIKKYDDYYESKLYDAGEQLEYGYGVFMRRVNAEGPVKIYEYWNTDEEFGFNQTFLEADGGTLFEVKQSGYREDMAKYFADYPVLQVRIELGDFPRRNLRELVEEYNEWKREQRKTFGQ